MPLIVVKILEYSVALARKSPPQAPVLTWEDI